MGSRNAFPNKSRSDSLYASVPDVLVFSHLRWDFVFQRPQHLMSRFAKTRRVFFFEEPETVSGQSDATLATKVCPRTGVVVITPQLPDQLSRFAVEEVQRELLHLFVEEQAIKRPIKWYYTPAMYRYSRDIEAAAVVYDCMDELANFRFASPQLPLLERQLMRRADLVFTGGYSLYEAKRNYHANVYLFPSSVDRDHFAKARDPNIREADDQRALPHPRLGFYGVLDERMDFPLIAATADAHPEWSIVLVGPVAKVSAEELPQRPNIHYLGRKDYQHLPHYLAGWDVALMPFAINEATRFISPTKTPEYLAAGKPVVSTPVTDVIREYGNLKCVGIAHTTSSFFACCERALSIKGSKACLDEADKALSRLSWDNTFAQMSALIDDAIKRREMVTATAVIADAKRQDHELRTEP